MSSPKSQDLVSERRRSPNDGCPVATGLRVDGYEGDHLHAAIARLTAALRPLILQRQCTVTAAIDAGVSMLNEDPENKRLKLRR
jgi:hypothetical protein